MQEPIIQNRARKAEMGIRIEMRWRAEKIVDLAKNMSEILAKYAGNIDQLGPGAVLNLDLDNHREIMRLCAEIDGLRLALSMIRREDQMPLIKEATNNEQ